MKEAVVFSQLRCCLSGLRLIGLMALGIEGFHQVFPSPGVIYLQNQHKEINRFVALVEVVFRRFLFLLIKLQFLYNTWMLNETQQDLL